MTQRKTALEAMLAVQGSDDKRVAAVVRALQEIAE